MVVTALHAAPGGTAPYSSRQLKRDDEAPFQGYALNWMLDWQLDYRMVFHSDSRLCGLSRRGRHINYINGL